MIRRYAELFPTDLAPGWLAICPWGALEWHGDHLPLGLDGIVAEGFSERLAERTGGVLLPTTWLPITTLPHRCSLTFSTNLVRQVLDELLEQLQAAGAGKVALVTGHYAQGHELEFYAAAARSPLPVYAATPLEPLEDEALLDHAGQHETAQLHLLRPDLIRLDQISPEVILGDPPQPPFEGEDLFARALDRWEAFLAEDPRMFYNRRRAAYQPYVDRYLKSNWEQAAADWWAEHQAK